MEAMRQKIGHRKRMRVKERERGTTREDRRK